VARTGRRVVRVEGVQVDAISSREHHDSTVTSRDGTAKLMLAIPDNLRS
jgi:hypothetical protein